jgi:hypothetical protein
MRPSVFPLPSVKVRLRPYFRYPFSPLLRLLMHIMRREILTMPKKMIFSIGGFYLLRFGA